MPGVMATRRRTVSVRNVNRRSSARRSGPGILTSLGGLLPKPDLKLEVESHVSRDIWAVVYLTLGVLSYLSLFGLLGPFGSWWDAEFRWIAGLGVYLIPALLGGAGLLMLLDQQLRINFTKFVGLALLTAAALGIVHSSAPEAAMWSQASEYGGMIGFVMSIFFRWPLGTLGAQIVLFALLIVGLLITFGVSIRDCIALVRALISGEEVAESASGELKINPPAELKVSEKDSAKVAKEMKAATGSKSESKPAAQETGKSAKDLFRINKPASIKLAQEFKPQKSRISDADWIAPSLDLLDAAAEAVAMDEAELRDKAEKIRQKLSSFGIEVTMHDVNVGPAVMQYTLKPAEGVKLSKIENLKSDLALALSAKSLRIEAPIPGKNLVGIEIPNDNRITVRMKEILQSKAFSEGKSNLRLVLGRDVAGHPIVGDLAAMPHLLVAGQTGSGKSVCINAFLLSLIYQNSPNDLRFILVDPKRVELVQYNGIPHLLTPVINDPDKTVSALKWALSEMTRRYTEFAKQRVRNLAEYNAANPDNRLSYIVIVIDELADLMMVSGKEVEACIVRLAQMARATGIHLIVATQRPSVDVITGLIKANIPTRIAFRTAQGVDSKTILDSVGAEDLLGRGDMLYVAPGASDPMRVQGAFVETAEVNRVTNAIKLELGEEEPEYDTDILDRSKTDAVEIPGLKPQPVTEDDSDEAIMLQALRVVLETKRASTSLLQRRMSLGYARAARIVDLMEQRGFVGPADGAKPRDIYITADRLAEIGGMAAAESNARLVDNMLNDMENDRTA